MAERGKGKTARSSKKEKTAPVAEPTQEITTQVVSAKGDKARQEEYLSKLIEWKAEGYDVKYLSDILEKNPANLAGEFERIEKNIEEIRKIENITIDVHGVEQETQALIESLNHPENLDEIRKRQKFLNDKIKLRTLGEQLDSLNTEGLEADAANARELMKDAAKVDEAEKAVKNIKAKIREGFFLGQIKKEAKPIPEPKKENMVKLSGEGAAPMEKSSMFVEDIFLLYKDCRFISHHTRTVRAENERPVVFKMLKAIRDYIRNSGQYAGDAINKVPYGNGSLLIYGSGSIIVGISITGEVPSWTKTVISRVFGLIDEKYHGALDGWSGDAKELEGLNQFMKVLMLTFVKLEAKAS